MMTGKIRNASKNCSKKSIISLINLLNLKEKGFDYSWNLIILVEKMSLARIIRKLSISFKVTSINFKWKTKF